MSKKNIIILIVSIVIAIAAIVTFVWFVIYTQILENDKPTIESTIPSPTPEPTEIPTIIPTPEKKFHAYDEEEKKRVDKIYPVDPEIYTTQEEIDDFYDYRYQRAVEIINKYTDYDFTIDEVIKELTPHNVDYSKAVLPNDHTVVGIDMNSDTSMGLSEYFITVVQPEVLPTMEDCYERAANAYGLDYDAASKTIKVDKFDWIQLTMNDYENLLTIDISKRPVVFNSFGSPIQYRDQLNMDLIEILMDDPSE